MSRASWIGAACAITISVGEAQAARPAWCGARDQEARKGIRSEAERRLTAQGLTESNLSLVAQLSCDKHDDPKLTTLIDGARADYRRLLGLTEAELADAMRLRLDPDAFASQIKQTCATLQPGAESSEQDKALLEAKRATLGCAGTVWNADWRRSTGDWGYWLDRDGEPASEVGHVAYVEQCLDYSYKRDFPDPEYDSAQRGYAKCGVDARRLDKTRFENELAEMKISEASRQAARETFARAKLISDQLTTAFKAKTDPAWKQILFDAPEKAFTDWQDAAAKWRTELDAVLAFEAKYYSPSKSATAGCGPALRAGWVKYLRAAKPKDAKQAEHVATYDPIGYLLASRLLACDHREGRSLLAAYEGTLLSHARRHRGPRRAAQWAAVEAINDVQKDREKFPLSASSIAPGGDPMYGPVSNVGNKIGYGENAYAEIKSVKKRSGGTLITFKTVKYQVDITTCTNTNRLRSVSSDGTLYWEQNCKSGGTEWRTSTEAPMLVPDEVAAGLKPSMFGTFRPDTATDPRGGFPTEIYTDKSKKQLAVFFGVPL